jgi:dihydrofolate reductase
MAAHLRDMGLLTFSINVTLDGCIDHREGIADEETHAFFTELMDRGGAMLWGRATYEMMESYWPAIWPPVCSGSRTRRRTACSSGAASLRPRWTRWT